MNKSTKPTKKEVPFELRFIASQMKLHRIKYKDIAARLKVTPSAVAHVLNGTAKSEAILSELRKLVNV
jgi:Mn-dependent DtxR family transcriptional regulator